MAWIWNMWLPARLRVDAGMTLAREDVLAALKALIDPVSGASLVDAGLVKALTVQDGAVRFVLEVSGNHAAAYGKVKDEVEAKLHALPGVEKLSVVMTAHSAPAAPPDLKLNRPAEPAGPQKIPGVDRIIAVCLLYTSPSPRDGLLS